LALCGLPKVARRTLARMFDLIRLSITAARVKWQFCNGSRLRDLAAAVNSRWVRIVGVSAFAFVVQIAVLNRISFLGVHLDVLLLAAVATGIRGGADRGAVVGFMAGLTTDVFSPAPLGIYAFSYVIAGFIAGYMARETSQLGWVDALIALVCSATALVAVLLVSSLSDVRSVPLSRQIWVILVIASTNAAFAPLVIRGWTKLDSRSRRGAWA